MTAQSEGSSADPTGGTLATQERGTQTAFACSDHLSAKITAMILKRTKTVTNSECRVGPLNFRVLSKNCMKFYFYTGLSIAQFNLIYTCLCNDVDKMSFWRGKRRTKHKVLNRTPKFKLSPQNQLLLTLIKLRQAFPNKDLAYRFGICMSTVSSIFNTWIQYLYQVTATIRERCFPSRQLIKENMPGCFKPFKNIRVIIDCFEIFAQQPTHFAEQGNMYSSYKHHTTLKGLVGIAPSGGISFLSDMFEGSISDKEIVKRSGLLDLLNPDDLVMADRGFDIKDLLQPRNVHLNIPPFLKNRKNLTPQEEIDTKRIARVRIHVERAIERMKKFKIIGCKIPLTIKPVIS